MPERELLLTGIGGQGVQLAAQIVARGAVGEGRSAMLFGSYGGMMRGGNTDATIVIGDGGPVVSPPTVASAWSSIVMHHDYWGFVRDRLRPGSLVLVNSTVFRGGPLGDELHVVEVPASDLALGLGNVMTASVVMVGALAAITGLVSLEALDAAVAESLPSYRQQHVELNRAALAAGAAAVDVGAHPAWETAGARR